MDVDLPNQDEEIIQASGDVRQDIAALGLSDLYFFNTAVLKYTDMTPRCHGPLCTFFTDNVAQFKLGLMPRDHYKTSCITIGGTLQAATRDPNSRSLIANESATNSERMLRAIRQHCEGNRVYRTLYSKVIPRDTRRAGLRWNDHELDFNRDWIGPEPTVDTVGMTGAFVSRHYTRINADDPISEEAVKSEKVMEDTINRFSGFQSLLVRPETDPIWLIGTRWALHDIYSWAMKNWQPRCAVYATGVFDDAGEPIFPELMGKELLAMKRLALGEYKFSCLYLNNPRDESIQDLNVKDLRFWRWYDAEQESIELFDSNGQGGRVVGLGQLDITCCVDLAPAETVSADRNAVTTVGTSPWGDMICLDSFTKRCTPMDLMEYLFYVNRRFHPRVFGIEDVAYQKAFKWFLRDEASKRGSYFNIFPIKAMGKKEHRIRGLQPIMATGRLYLPPNAHVLRNEMSDFPLGEHDDAVDSLSMHLQVMSGVMSPEALARRLQAENKIVARLLGRTESPDGFDDLMYGTQYTGSYAA